MNFRAKILIIIFTLFYMSSVWARIILDVSIVYKKGIDKGLVLVSELHSVEDLSGTEYVVIKMKNGLKVKLSAEFVQNFIDYGPSALVQVEGEVYNKFGKLLKEFANPALVVEIGQKKTVIHRDDAGELIEITIHANVK